MRGYHRIDSVHKQIREAARKAGFRWVDTFRQGDGFPDAFCLSKGGHWLALEIKSPGGKLTPAERAMMSKFEGSPWAVIHSFEELQELLERLDARL